MQPLSHTLSLYPALWPSAPLALLLSRLLFPSPFFATTHTTTITTTTTTTTSSRTGRRENAVGGTPPDVFVSYTYKKLSNGTLRSRDVVSGGEVCRAVSIALGRRGYCCYTCISCPIDMNYGKIASITPERQSAEILSTTAQARGFQ